MSEFEFIADPEQVGEFLNEELETAMKTLEWAVECGYISMITDAFLGRAETGLAEIRRNFNDDRDCFIRYCEMQKSSAVREGHPDSATYIQHCLDDLGAPSHEPA